MTDEDSRRDARLQELLDRDSIRECLYRYARAIDRGDTECLRSVYWPDATDDHGVFSGNAAAFVDWIVSLRPSRIRSAHHLTNLSIRLETRAAQVETYFLALLTLRNPQGQPYDVILAGRYLDHMEKRGDEWRIKARKVVFDWFRQYEDTHECRTPRRSIETGSLRRTASWWAPC